ncbi:MAG TPA: type II toxin-antitoxin system VapC family toxin [Thermomicrobiales bacterium]
MTQYFCDSSAIIKRYVTERGSGWVRALASPASTDRLIVAQITRVEVVSGIARLRREGTLDNDAVGSARYLLDRHMAREYMVIELSEMINRRAEDLLLAHPLRAYDAVQLASALDTAAFFAAVGLAAPIFVSADRRLLAAAEAEGLIADDPNRHS